MVTMGSTRLTVVGTFKLIIRFEVSLYAPLFDPGNKGCILSEDMAITNCMNLRW